MLLNVKYYTCLLINILANYVNLSQIEDSLQMICQAELIKRSGVELKHWFKILNKCMIIKLSQLTTLDMQPYISI